MELEEIKKEMLEWRDFYGNSLNEDDAINRCESIHGINCILWVHETRLQRKLQDALSHLEGFKRRLNL